MKLSLLISLLALTAMGKPAGVYSDTSVVTEHDREVIQYYLSGMHGLWAGYMEVFHHGHQIVDDKCFKEESAHEII